MNVTRPSDSDEAWVEWWWLWEVGWDLHLREFQYARQYWQEYLPGYADQYPDPLGAMTT